MVVAWVWRAAMAVVGAAAVCASGGAQTAAAGSQEPGTTIRTESNLVLVDGR
jgi:hypothetical protein